MNFDMAHQIKSNAKRVRSISDHELSRFLRHLSILYRDEATGNPPLSAALDALADKLSGGRKQKQLALPIENDELSVAIRNTDSATLNRLIEEENLSKKDLIRVGTERFSIPQSKLMRMNREGVIAELRSAIIHEESLSIIEKEAERGGSKRIS